MGQTITTSGTLGLHLNHRADGPLRVLDDVTIASVGSYAVLGTGPFAFRISNLGSLSGATAGVDLQHGGIVTNGSGQARDASITGGRYGVYIGGGIGTVRNLGTVASSFVAETTYPLNSYGYTITGGVGIQLGAGGTVMNGGPFGRLGMVEGGAYGIRIQGGSGFVLNTGTVVGRGAYSFTGDSLSGTGFRGTGVLVNSGSVRNGGGGVASATIIGGSVGVSIVAGGGYVSNFGTITANSAAVEIGSYPHSIIMRAGGTGVAFAGSGTVEQVGGAVIAGAEFGVIIAGAGTVSNFGTIVGIGKTTRATQSQTVTTYSGVGVSLGSGGFVLNGGGTGGLIQGGAAGIVVSGQTGTVVNQGTVVGSGFAQTATMGGTVVQSPVGVGVLMTQGGQVQNGYLGGHGASIIGSMVGVEISGGGASVLNYDLVSGSEGVVFGSNVGVARLVNGGSVIGTSGTAVRFASGDDTVVLQPGGTFVGDVIASAGGANTLVLGSSVSSTLSGFGTQYQNFGTIAEYDNARWSLTGHNTARVLTVAPGTGAVLTIAGDLTLSGSDPTLTVLGGTFGVTAGGSVTLGDGPAGAAGALTINAGTVSASGTIAAAVVDNYYLNIHGSLLLAGTIQGSGSVMIGAQGVLELLGASSVARTDFSGVAGRLVLDQPAAFNSSILDFNQTDLIDFAHQTVTAVHFDMNTYKLGVFDGVTQIASLKLVGNFYGDMFTVAADGHGGTNVILR